jgi:hypothetical protein
MSFSFVFCKTWTMQWRCNRQREELNVCNFKVLTQNLTCLIWFFVGIIFCIDNCRICNSMFNVVSLEVGEVQMQRGGEQIQSRYITIICAFNFKMFFYFYGKFFNFWFQFSIFSSAFFHSPTISIWSKFTTHLRFKAQVFFVVKFVFIAFKLLQMSFCSSLNVSCILKVH